MPYKGFSSVSIRDAVYKKVQNYIDNHKEKLAIRRIIKISHFVESACIFYLKVDELGFFDDIETPESRLERIYKKLEEEKKTSSQS